MGQAAGTGTGSAAALGRGHRARGSPTAPGGVQRCPCCHRLSRQGVVGWPKGATGFPRKGWQGAGGILGAQGAQGAALQVSGHIPSTQAMGGSRAGGRRKGMLGAGKRVVEAESAGDCGEVSLLPPASSSERQWVPPPPAPPQCCSHCQWGEQGLPEVRQVHQVSAALHRDGDAPGRGLCRVPQAPGTAAVAGTEPPQPRGSPGDAELGTVPMKVAGEGHLPGGGLKAPKSSWTRGSFYG